MFKFGFANYLTKIFKIERKRLKQNFFLIFTLIIIFSASGALIFIGVKKKIKDRQALLSQNFDELLIKIGENSDLPGSFRDGDIVEIRPAGHPRGSDEEKEFLFVRVPKLTDEEKNKLMQPEYKKVIDKKEEEEDGQIIRIRKYGIDYTNLLTEREVNQLRKKMFKFKKVVLAGKSEIKEKKLSQLSVISSEKRLTSQKLDPPPMIAWLIKLRDAISHPVLAQTITVKTIKSSGGDYASLNAWQAGRSGNIVTRDTVEKAECYNFSDPAPVALSGWTTDTSHYVEIYAADGNKHNGLWSTSAYRLEVNSTVTVIDVSGIGNLTIRDLQISNTTTGNGRGIRVITNTASAVINIYRNIIKTTSAGNASAGIVVGMNTGQFRGTANLYNNIVYNWKASVGKGMGFNFGVTVANIYAYNNTVYNNDTGIFIDAVNASTVVVLKNNISNSCVSYCYLGTADATATNISSDATSPDTAWRSKTVAFVSTTSGSEDFHLAASDTTGAINGGTNVSSGDAYLNFSDDIDNQTRGSIWDIGADEAGVAVSGTIYSDEGSTVYNCASNNLTVKIKINGAIGGANNNTGNCTLSNGTYTVYSVPISAASDVLTAFIVTAGVNKAVTVTRAADTSSNITGFDFYQKYLIVRHEDAGPITNANLGVFDEDDNSYLNFTSNSNNLVVDNDTGFHLWAGKSYSPGGKITSSNGGTSPGGDIHLDDNSTLTAGGDIFCGGSWTADAGTIFTPNSNHLLFTATTTGKTITPGSSSFYDVDFSSRSWSTSYDTAEGSIKALLFEPWYKVIYAGSYDSGIIYRCDTSTGCDASGDWTTSYDTPEYGIYSFGEAFNNGLIFAGSSSGGIIYRCSVLTNCDASGDWTTSYDTPALAVDSFVWDYANNIIYAGTEGNPGGTGIIYRCALSTGCDASGDWTTSYTPPLYGGIGINAMAFDFTNNVIYATSSGAILRCDTSTGCDETADWTTSYSSGITFFSLAFDTANKVVYAGYTGAILRCDTSTLCDASGDWTTANSTSEIIFSLAYDSSKRVIYAGTYSNGYIYYCNTVTGCDASGDWTISYDSPESYIYSLAVDTTNKVIYAGSSSNGIIYRDAYGGGGWTFQTNATTTDNFIITSGAVTGPSFGHLAVGGSWANGNTFTPNNSEVKFDATATGKTLSSSGTGNSFYAVDFNSSSGGWTAQDNATSTNNWKLTSGAFTANSGVHLEVDGQFSNLTSQATTWTSSFLYLNSGSAYTINSKTAGSDTYGTLETGANTDIRMWDSSASSYNVSSSGSLYSMDHAGASGDLAIYGDYHIPSSSTDYWSYATDFDGTGGANRQVDVLVADSATINIDAGTILQIIGTNTATTTATSTSVAGSYGFTLTNGALNAQYYKFGRLNTSGLNLTGASATITNLANGEFDNSAGTGTTDTFITVAGAVITNNPAKTFTQCNFANSNGNANYNVTATDTTDSYWTFSSSYGAFDGEANDSDPGGDPGYIRWDDSTIGSLSVTASTTTTFSAITYTLTGYNNTDNLMRAVTISDTRGGSPGWTVNLTSSDWSDGSHTMDYDGNGSTSGQLCVVLTGATLYATSGSMTGVSLGTDDCFSVGTSQVDLVTASVGNGTGAYWIVDPTLSQFIPAIQSPGTYTTTLTFTAS